MLFCFYIGTFRPVCKKKLWLIRYCTQGFIWLELKKYDGKWPLAKFNWLNFTFELKLMKKCTKWKHEHALLSKSDNFVQVETRKWPKRAEKWLKSADECPANHQISIRERLLYFKLHIWLVCTCFIRQSE